MRGRGPLLALLLVLGALVVGLAVLFRLRLAQGDLFPPYSSLRADPLGTRALHDSLAGAGLRVTRQHRPVEDLPRDPPRAILVAGVHVENWGNLDREQFDAIDAAVRAGSRLVITLRTRAARTREEQAEEREREEEAEERKSMRELTEEFARRARLVDLSQRWGVKISERRLVDRDGEPAARAAADARLAGLPERIPWRSDLFFEVSAADGWRVFYRRAGEPVLVMRPHGRGAIVVAADSYFLSNEALQKDRLPALLAWIVGPHGRVEFDEVHLGVMQQPGVAALARRYGLGAAFFTLLLLAALFVWRRMALFVPPAESGPEVALSYHPAAGLEALLRRSVSAAELAPTCVTEWKPTARESDRARVERAFAAEPKNAAPVTLYNAAVRALRRRSAVAPALAAGPSRFEHDNRNGLPTSGSPTTSKLSP